MLLDEKVRIQATSSAPAHRQSSAAAARGPCGEHGNERACISTDIVRDLKRIAAHIASVAYPVLDKNGMLLRSRVAIIEGDSRDTEFDLASTISALSAAP